MVRNIFLGITIGLLMYAGWTIGDEYLYMHTYYAKMFANWSNIQVVLLGCIAACLPTAYILLAKRYSLWAMLGSIFGGLVFFSIAHIGIRGDMLGGHFSLIIHLAFLFFLALFFLCAWLSVGGRIYRRIMKHDIKTMFGLCLSLGLGLASFLLISYCLVMTNMLYPLITWLLVGGAAVLMWWERKELGHVWKLLSNALGTLRVDRHSLWYALFSIPFLALGILALFYGTNFGSWVSLLVGAGMLFAWIQHSVRHRDWGWHILMSWQGLLAIVLMLLLLMTFRYMYVGIQLAYLPYPTAWDANHAYMFYPKMWALHHGYYRAEPSMSYAAHLRPMYITFFFSLFSPFTHVLGIAPDTIAIEMNFWSGILVLIFGLGLVAEFIRFMRGTYGDDARATHIDMTIFYLGWFLLLQWLMSGMGAFLVFIDNKTDMGVFALIILALYSGFVFLNVLRKSTTDDAESVEDTTNVKKYIVFSGVLYGIAVLAKPTALFDVVNFGLFLWVLWLGVGGFIGAFFLLIGLMAGIDFRGIKDYIPASLAPALMAIGGLGIGIDAVRIWLQRTWKYVQYLLMWTGALLLTILIVKVPFVIADTIIKDKPISPGTMLERVLLAQTNEESVPVAACSVEGQGFTNTEQLYENTKKSSGSAYNEDVGRYVGFGRKGNKQTDANRGIFPLLNPWWAKTMSPGCYGFNPFSPARARAGKALCAQEKAIDAMDSAVLANLAQSIDADVVHGNEYIRAVLEDMHTSIQADPTGNHVSTLRPQLQTLQAFMQQNSIKVEYIEDVKQVFFPYKYLAPFNITFNRSLQNLSSYYTDIGIMWLLLLVLVVLGCLYGAIRRERFLVGISAVTLFGWVLWWFVGGSILWYAIGIIAWTILASIAYIWYLIQGGKDDARDEFTTACSIILLVTLFGIGLWQMSMNMIRISTQGGGGAFLWYKTGHGRQEVINDQLQTENIIDRSYGAADVFDMQFRHYKKFIALANESGPDEGSLIAGTYARYFVEDQTHVKYDQFLTWLRTMFSDGDACNAYLRLQDNNLKYIVIDPNIGTVVQGGGNQSLFDRLFARVDGGTNVILEHGVMTMLAQMYQQGYVRFVSSNNLGAKYAFILPDTAFAGLTGDALTLQRARMSLARFFNSTAAIQQSILQIAEQRVQDGMFVTDIADLMGLQIRESHLLELLRKPQLSPTDIQGLSDDEKKALTQYLGLRQLAATNPEGLRTQLQNIIKQSIGGGNQLIVLSLE